MFIEDPKEAAFNFGWPPGTTVRICGGNYRGFMGTVVDGAWYDSDREYMRSLVVGVHDGPTRVILVENLEFVSFPEWAEKLGIPGRDVVWEIGDTGELCQKTFRWSKAKVTAVDEDGMHVTVSILNGPLSGVECRLHKSSLSKIPEASNAEAV